jgi:hypothetical protein
VDEGAASRDANDVLMLRSKLKSLEERSVIANKYVLEAEKERDKFHKELELIEVQLQGKRVHTHDDTGDGHDMHTEVDARLGLVGWIAYWCNGDSALTVDVVVSLIKMLDLNE